MTLQKALKIIDWWINQKRRAIEHLEKEWDYTTDSLGVGKTLLDMDRIVISNLEKIRKELTPNCKHPKKMRDKAPNGKWYCMNCNSDL
ncbi:MAG: hypothetical protein OEM89_02395 [Nitrosopumilus sp.]|nr:hypothetical protein [Nitrosopumilus sp.]